MRVVIAVILLVLFIIGLVLMVTEVNFYGTNAGTVLMALVVAYTLLSLGSVQADEVAAMFVFGKPIGTNADPNSGDIGSGLYFAPYGIVEVWKENGTLFQDELPCDPEKIFRGKDGDPIPEGMFPPIRIKFGQPRLPKLVKGVLDFTELDAEDISLIDDPYNVPMVVEVVPVICWRISSATRFRIVYKTTENFRKISGDKAVGVFGDKFAAVTPAKASLHLGATSTELENTLVNETAGTGVDINDSYVKPFNYSHALNASVVDVSIANEKAKAVRKTADGEKYRLTEEGEGAANAMKSMLIARSIGVEKLAEISKTPEGQITLWMETMAKAFEKAQYSIVPGSDVYTAFAGLSEVLKKVDSTKVVK